jgi:pimeloyl-ACP methyl ester carboxylesterase
VSPNSITTERYYVDNHWLEAVRIKESQANLPTIVMLHEGLGSVAHWKSFPFRLAEQTGAGVFVYSRYGHGGSDPLEHSRSASYMHREAEVVLPEILRQAGIVMPLIFGHSDGASIALIFAGVFPEAPAGLILEAPHVSVEDVTVSSIAAARTAYRETDLRQRLARYHANVDALFWGWNQIWLDPDFRDWNIESFLGHIRCPVLVLQGAQDEYGTTQQAVAIRNQIPSAAVMVLENCKHSPHRDRADAVLSATGEFLDAIPKVERTSSSSSTDSSS